MAVGTAIAGITLSAGGRIAGGIRARKAAKKQARLLKDQARLEREAAEFDAMQQERQFEKLLGRQRAGFSVSGVKLEGSALDILKETMRDKEETVQNILETGSARGSALEAKARLTKRAGRDAFIGSILGATGTALKGGAQIGGAA